MSDGHGSTPDTPPGWAPNQPPPYGDGPGSPWATPGSGPGAPSPYQPPPPPQSPYGSPGAPPYQEHPHASQGQQPYGQQPPGQPPYGQQPPPYGYRQPPPAALRPGIIPLRPLGLGDIIDGAIKLIRSNPKAVLGLSAIAAVLGAIPVAIGQALSLGRIGAALESLENDPSSLESSPSQTDFLVQYGGSLVSYAVQFVAVTLLSGVLTRILGRAVFGGKITAGEAWRLTRGRVPTLFGLVGIDALILLLPMVLIVGLTLGLAAAGTDTGSALLLFGLAIVAYIVYAAFLTTRLVLAAPAAVLERSGVFASLRRSWSLTRGSFWRMFGILLLTGIIAGLVGMVIAIPFTFAGTIAGVLGQGGTGSQIAAAILFAIGGTVGAMITYPFQAGVSGLLYADRRMRAEAFDLVLQTAAIEQQRQGWVHSSADDLWGPPATPGGQPGHPGQPGQGAPWTGH
ncbi:glycerophosphoryl diester phosphodiesterase membrane domain-containing protein [Streptosporangium sp. NPDC051023]|uniref:glycerophosphoryl diester phosphodiesterase membrane domain-containing protein n=1 Tax=Streptosporangium sp. NPDC051023 TaxID=3155410 RepID=UPI00344C3BF5